MEDIARGVLAGIALGGFTATMFEVNLFALKALRHVNRLATKTAWKMVQGVKTILERPERVARQQIERERELLRELRQVAAENSET